MNSILQDLFYGRLHPYQFQQKPTPEYLAAEHAFEQQKISLLSTLNQDQKQFLEQMLEKHLRLLSLDIEAQFCNGFRLGVKMMAEALVRQEKEENTDEI